MCMHARLCVSVCVSGNVCLPSGWEQWGRHFPEGSVVNLPDNSGTETLKFNKGLINTHTQAGTEEERLIITAVLVL